MINASPNNIQIRIDDLTNSAVISLLQEHLDDMYATSPPESVHALDVNTLRAPNITFFSAWSDDLLAGCVAIKALDANDAELKSMRTSHQFRNKGVATQLLKHCLQYAKHQGFVTISLETGTQDYFVPAHQLYRKHGFQDCGPFSHYQKNPNSRFMTITL